MKVLCISPKDVYFIKRLKQEAVLANVALEVVIPFELEALDFNLLAKTYDCLYVRFCNAHFIKIIELAKAFTKAGKPVIDESITQGSIGINKIRDAKKIEEAGLPQPQTKMFLEAKSWQYPCIVKWNFGFGGKEVFLAKSVNDIYRASSFLPPEELLIQEFFEAEYEYKVLCAGYKALPVILRFNISKKNWRPDFDTSVTIDLRSDNLAARQVAGLAEAVSKVLGRELSKTDILQKDNKFYVLECNRWPGLKSFEEQTGYNAVGEFLKYLIKK